MNTYPTIESRVLGEQMVFLQTSAQTGGELVEMEVRYAAGQSWEDAPFHLHPLQDEEFTVLEGMMTVEIAGVKRTYVAGERFAIPRGTEHVMRNLASVPVRVNWQVRPALQTEEFFTTVFGLADEGKLYRPLQFAVIAQAYRQVFQLTRLPLIQRVLLRPLAVVGRLLGYRSYNEAYRPQAAPLLPSIDTTGSV